MRKEQMLIDEPEMASEDEHSLAYFVLVDVAVQDVTLWRQKSAYQLTRKSE
jgi:hypothetical protein